jgi:protein translocase SecG subunit
LTLLAAAAAAAQTVKLAAPKKGTVPIINTTVNPVAAPVSQTWFQQHAGWLTHGIAGLFIIAAVSLVVMLAVQTTKQEGLSGTIGGRVESSYGRMGAEEQLKRMTGFAAFVFVLTGFVLSLTGI